MNTRIGTDGAQATVWEKFYHWVHALDEALDYDPQEQLYKSHKRLNQQVENLQARIQDLEKREKQEA